MLSAFHSAVLAVADFSAAVNHYASLLGRPPTLVARTGEGREVARFALDNMMLELRAGAGTEGLSSIRLGTVALDEATQKLRERGVEHGPACEEKLVVLDAAAKGPAAAHAIATERSVEIDPVSSRGIGLFLIEAGEAPPRFEDAAKGLDEPAGIRALDHVVVFSAAIDRTRAFYEEALGIRLALDKTFEKRGVRLLFFRLGGTTIEIGGRLEAPEDPEAQDRFGGLAWQVNDIEAIQARLQGEGFDVSKVRDGHKPGTRVCTVRDRTHGVPTLLIEPVR